MSRKARIDFLRDVTGSVAALEVAPPPVVSLVSSLFWPKLSFAPVILVRTHGCRSKAFQVRTVFHFRSS